MKQIKLGDTVKCKVTGFKGVAVSRTEFLNGCIQYGIVPKVSKDCKYPEEVGIDEDSLEIISIDKTKEKKKPKKLPGGAVTRGIGMKGY